MIQTIYGLSLLSVNSAFWIRTMMSKYILGVQGIPEVDEQKLWISLLAQEISNNLICFRSWIFYEIL